jgi:hypothetical protein
MFGLLFFMMSRFANGAMLGATAVADYAERYQFARRMQTLPGSLTTALRAQPARDYGAMHCQYSPALLDSKSADCCPAWHVCTIVFLLLAVADISCGAPLRASCAWNLDALLGELKSFILARLKNYLRGRMNVWQNS